MQFTAMTFNLRYPTPNDGPDYWPNRVEIAAEAIRRHDPLFVGTQEGYLTMLKDLEPKLEGYAWFGEGRNGNHENEHCAIWYKKDELELAEEGTFWLSETPETPASISWDSSLTRICTWGCFVHKPTRQPFAVFNTHLDHRGQEARNRGSILIWERIMQLRGEGTVSIPVILTGDFNSQPGTPPIRFFRGESELGGSKARLNDAYSLLPGNPGLTAHSFKGGAEGEPIDYIFTTDEFEFVEVKVDRTEFGGKYPSDHYPVVARMKRKHV